MERVEREPTLTFLIDMVLDANGELVRYTTPPEREYLIDILKTKQAGSAINTTPSRMFENVRAWKEGEKKRAKESEYIGDRRFENFFKPGELENIQSNNLASGYDYDAHMEAFFKAKERGGKMKLYEIYIVETTEQEVVYQDAVIAKDPEQAKMKVLAEALGGMSIESEKLTDYQFICSEVGTVDAPENK